MRTRITMLAIFVVAIGAIALIWRFPRSSGASTEVGATTASSASGSVGDGHPAGKDKPLAKSPASGGKPSPGCLDCQKRECWNLIDGCSTLAGNAAEGPAAGTP